MKELSTFQKDLILKEIVEYIEKYKLTCGDDVINMGEPSMEAKYHFAEIVDIALKTNPKGYDSYKGLQEH